MPTGKKAAPKPLEGNGAPDDGLTEKERAFVAEYFRCGFNGTLAAIAAGYTKNKNSAKVQASKLLTKSNVQAALAVKRAERNSKIQSEVVDIIAELEYIAFARMGRFAKVTERGSVRFTPTEKLEPEGWDAAIQSYTETTTEHGGSTGLKMHDKLKALELLGKYRGMWTKDDGSGSDGDDSGARTTDFGRVRASLGRLGKGQ
jgi:phage terminase small subunit